MNTIVQFVTSAAIGGVIPVAIYLTGRIAEHRLDARQAARRNRTTRRQEVTTR